MLSPDSVARQVEEAAGRVAGAVEVTRVVPTPDLSTALGCNLHLKLECEQRTGSFKLRGAHSKLSRLQGSGLKVAPTNITGWDAAQL